MPAVIPLAIMAGTAISGVYAAHKQSESADKAAQAQSTSNTAALDFEKQKDAEDRTQAERTQRANYDQYESERRTNYDHYLTKYSAAKSLGGEYGLNLPDAQPYTSVPYAGDTAAASGQPAGTQGAGDPAAFIANYQKTHSPTEGPSGILTAMKAAGFNVAPYLYGQTPSNNEISLNGSKYKVISGEDGPTPAWYRAGMNDGGGGGGIRSTTPPPITSSYLAALRPQMTPETPDFKLKSINAFL